MLTRFRKCFGHSFPSVSTRKTSSTYPLQVFCTSSLRSQNLRLTPKVPVSFFTMGKNQDKKGKCNSDKTVDGPVVIQEGDGEVVFENGEVFYNEVQIKNRDLSTLVLNAYATQIEEEAKTQVRRRSANQRWRRIDPTWTTWGADTSDGELIPDKGVDQKKLEIPKVNPESLDVPGLFVLEALGASGLRSIRYSKEIKDGCGIDKIICNDLEVHAVENIKKNIEHNKISKDTLVANQGDAVQVMMQHRYQNLKGQHTRVKEYLTEDVRVRDHEKDPFDVVDIDPYGSPSIFLDSAVQCVRDGGLLCVTATDLATMCGKNLEVCYSKYGSMSLKAKYGHEMAIRIVLATLERKANVYGRFIVPILSVQMDFYLRVFVRVYTSKAEIKKSAAKMGLVVQSTGCDSFYIQPLAKEVNNVHKCPSVDVPSVCPETGEAMRIAGPIWTKPIHNPEFVKCLLDMFKGDEKSNDSLNFDPNKLGAAKIVKGILVAVSEEVPDVPLHYCLPSLSKILRCSVPPMAKVHGALMNAGYKVSQVHCDSNGLKTDAPPEVVWDVMRAWLRKIEPGLDPSKRSKKAAKKISDKSPTSREKARVSILTKEPSISINFSIPGSLLSKLKKRKENMDRISRWTPNPQPNWGPKARARGSNKFQTHPKDRKNRDRKRQNNSQNSSGKKQRTS